MNREPWVAYVVVVLIVAAMMYGKYLIAQGDDEVTTNDQDKKE